jgi:hypothetical protein
MHLTDNNWVSLKAEAVKHSDAFDSDLLWTGQTILGFGAEYAYNTIMGPFKANIHYSNLTKRFGAYLSFGFDF